MTLVLLIWFLVAPSLPGADPDARLVAARLRGRVARMLAAPVFVALLLWLGGCLIGVCGVLIALLTGSSALAVLGPVPAVIGAAAGWLLLVVVGLRERAWLESLGLPDDWREPWLAGELADHLGWSSCPTAEPRLDSLSGPRVRATSSFGSSRPSPTAGEGPTPVDRWRPSPADPTETMNPGGDGSAADWLDDQTPNTVQLPRIQPRIRGVRFVDAARLRTPPMAEG